MPLTLTNMRSKFFLKKIDKSKFISYICCYKYVLFLLNLKLNKYEKLQSKTH